MTIAKKTGDFKSTQGLPDTTKVDLNQSTDYMYEFIELFVGSSIVTGGVEGLSGRVTYPKLYKANETDFSHNGLGLLVDAISAVPMEELNGMFEMKIEYDSVGFLADEIKEEMIIKAKANDKQDEQLFRIYSITKKHESDSLVIDAQHITYDLANDFVPELIADNMSKKQVMEQILINSVGTSKNKFIMTSPNDLTMSSTKLYRTNPLQMVGGTQGSILQIWGGQIERDNYRLVMHDRRGSDDGVTVSYAKNITGLEAKFDFSKVVTRIFPFKFVEESDDEPERLITIGDANGGNDYIDSTLIDNYEQVYIEPYDLSDEESIETSKDLYDLSKDFFEKQDKPDHPKVEMEVNFETLWETEEYKDVALLELVGMGDTVTIHHSILKIDVQANVNLIEFDSLTRKNKSVELGNVKAKLTDKVNRVDDIAQSASDANKKADQAIVSSNGKNTTYYGPSEPEKAKKGDLWFKIVDGEYTRTYRFDGMEWQLIVDMDSNEAKESANEAKQSAQGAVDKANKAIEDAQGAFDKAESVSVIANENTGEITTIKQIAEGLQTRVENNEGGITTVTQLANTLASRVEKIGNFNMIPHERGEWFQFQTLAILLNDNQEIEPETTYTFTNYSTIPFDSIDINLLDSEGQFLTKHTLTTMGESITFTTSRLEVLFSVSISNDGVYRKDLGTKIKLMLSEGADKLPFTLSSSEVASQITQLADNINLRVEKGDVINQINIDNSGILISGENLVLDGNTTVNGSFKVRNANIMELDAGKITAGTFDAAKASIINLNVSSLIGNKASFVQSAFNDIGNQVSISPSGLTTYEGGLRTSFLNGKGHEFYNRGTSIGTIGTKNWVGDTSYKGLAFSLESEADYMTWSFRETADAGAYTTMLSWHKTNRKTNSGFHFDDKVYLNQNVEVSTSKNLYVRSLATYGWTDGNRRIEFGNQIWNGRNGVRIAMDGKAGLWTYKNAAALISNGDAHIEVGQDSTGNRVYSTDIPNRKYTGAPNVYVTSSGTLGRTSSSARYKLYQKEIELSEARKVLNLSAMSWFDKIQTELHADYLTKLNSGEKCTEEDKSEENIRRTGGFIAEEVHAAGLPMFVNYNDEGDPENIESNFWTLFLPIIKDHENRLIEVEETIYSKFQNRINELESRVKKLEGVA